MRFIRDTRNITRIGGAGGVTLKQKIERPLFRLVWFIMPAGTYLYRLSHVMSVVIQGAAFAIICLCGFYRQDVFSEFLILSHVPSMTYANHVQLGYWVCILRASCVHSMCVLRASDVRDTYALFTIIYYEDATKI